MTTPKKSLSKKDKVTVTNATHHIRKWKNRPYWLKIRIDQGPKFVGKDVYVPLKTHDMDTARQLRDGVMAALKHGGFVCIRKENHDDELMHEDQVRKEA